MSQKKAFWLTKTVLLTGHTGFKGSWLSLWLAQMGARVVGYALPDQTAQSFFSLCGLEQRIESIYGDILDLEKFTAVCARVKPDIIIHMAAQSLVLPSYADPIKTYQTNVMGTINVFEAARQSQDCKLVLNITSDKCYENKNWVWPYRENDPMGGHDPYSSSKACAELVTDAYRQSYFTPKGLVLASARAGNCIGGGDWSLNRLIPDIMRSYQSGARLEIRAPNTIRPWQHVLEPLSGYLSLCEYAWNHPEASAAWNFGPAAEAARSVNWLVEAASELLGERFKYDCRTTSPEWHEAPTLKVDSSKANSQLNWKVLLSNEQIMQWTIDWYLASFAKQDMLAYSINQIKQYELKTQLAV